MTIKPIARSPRIATYDTNRAQLGLMSGNPKSPTSQLVITSNIEHGRLVAISLGAMLVGKR